MNKQVLILVGSSTVTTAVGSVAGYFFAKKKLEQKYIDKAEQEIAEAKVEYANKYLDKAEQEIAEAKEQFRRTYKADEFETIEAAGAALLDQSPVSDKDLKRMVRKFQYDKMFVPPAQRAEEVQHNNIFDQVRENFSDLKDDEIDERPLDRPYLISEREYMEGENRYSQTTMTYFAGDNVCADEEDVALDDNNQTLGDANLKHLGEEFKTIYIRNDRLNRDFEVVYAAESYAELVLGIVDKRPVDERRQR